MAESSFRMATSLNRRYAEAWFAARPHARVRGRLNEARIAYETLLDVEPGNERSLLALIEVVRHQGGADVLVSRIEAAEAAGLRRPAALRMRCAAFDITHEHERALQAALEWQALQPGVHEPIFAEGSALLGLGRTQEALQRLLRAHDLEPGHIETIVNTAHALHKLERYAEACRYYQIALRAEPSRTPALHGLSYALFKTAGKKRPDNLRLALRATRELMRRTSEGPITHAAIGAIFFAQLRVRDGLRHFRRSAELDGAATATLSSLLFHSNYSDEISCQEHYELHLQWAAKLRAELGPQFTAFKHSRDPERRLRVGFVTADMCFHPVGYFLLPIVRGLANDFDLRLYSALAQGSEDEFTARFRDRVGDGFKRIAGLSDAEAAEIIRRDEVDVLFDLSGHTTGHRLGVFARRAAPVQVSWLGYPNTTGLDSMDFRLSDPVTEPEGEADRYSSERIVRLPAGFHNYQPFYRFPDVGPLPALKNGWVTLGCFKQHAQGVAAHAGPMGARDEEAAQLAPAAQGPHARLPREPRAGVLPLRRARHQPLAHQHQGDDRQQRGPPFHVFGRRHRAGCLPLQRHHHDLRGALHGLPGRDFAGRPARGARHGQPVDPRRTSRVDRRRRGRLRPTRSPPGLRSRRAGPHPGAPAGRPGTVPTLRHKQVRERLRHRHPLDVARALRRTQRTFNIPKRA
jgi:tetratricopeptide (TPR) repeat protein